MNCAFCERATNIVEKSFFIWKDLVLAEKSSKERTPNHFWQFFSFFEEF